MLETPQNQSEPDVSPLGLAESQPSTNRTYSMIDLFAGCGGLSLGFENAGFTPVFVNELNNDALNTYLTNRKHSLGNLKFAENPDLHCNDANELDKVRLEKLQSDLSSISELGLKFANCGPTKLDGNTLDVLTGGPPCQGYSGIGHRRSYKVDKKDLPSNKLYLRMCNVIRTMKPRTFLFENVRGILNSRWTSDSEDFIWPDVLREFRSIRGYEVRWKLVHAKDYGVPQNRPRVLLVGIRNDILEGNSQIDLAADEEDAVRCGFLPEPYEGQYPDLCDLLGDLVDPAIEETLLSGNFQPGLFATSKYQSEPAGIQEILRRPPKHFSGNTVVELTEQVYSKHKPIVVEKFVAMHKSKGEIPEKYKTKKFSQRLLPERWGNQGPTITATSLPDDYVHFSQPRILTVREWARLQLFPDWYIFTGKRTTGGIRRAGNPQEGNFDREVPKYTQIGNAVPVGLASCVGQHLKQIIDNAIN